MSLVSAGRDAYRVDPDGIRFVMCEGPLHVVFGIGRETLAKLVIRDLKAGRIHAGEIMSRTFLRRRAEIEAVARRKHADGDRSATVSMADFERIGVAA